MKTIRNIFATIILIILMADSNKVDCQTIMGIIPVNYSQVSSSVLNIQQWQGVSEQMQNQFSLQLAGIGNIKKLTREHILLLLKEVPAPDPDNLNAEAYKVISKKESLQYMLKCSIESMQVIDKNVLVPIRVIIIDGSNGKVFWEKSLKINKIVSNPVLSEHILLNEVFKPAINDVSREIKALKY